MGTRGEHFDRLEAVAGDERQVLARQPVVVKEMRGKTEAPLVHGALILPRAAGPSVCGGAEAPPYVNQRSSCSTAASSSRSRPNLAWRSRLVRA